MRIKKKNINKNVLFVSIILTVIWLPPYSFGQNYYWICQLTVLVSSIYYLIKFLLINKFKIDKKYKIYVCIFIYWVSTMISSVANTNFGDILAQTIFAINLFGMFSFFQTTAKKSLYSSMIGIAIVLFFYLIEDLMMLGKVGIGDTWSYKIYFTGGKFDVGYNVLILLFSFYAAIQFQKRRRSKLRALLFYMSVVLGAILCMQFDCMTAMLSIASILIFYVVLNWKKFNPSPKFMLMTLIGSGFVIFILSSIMQLEFVEYFVTQILGRTSTLTGRLGIYYSSQFANIIKNSFLFGVGRSGTYSAMLIGYSNVQNGFFQIMYLYGILGLFSFLLLNYTYLKHVCNNNNSVIVLSFYMAYIIFSVGEISFNYTEFFFFLAQSYSYVVPTERLQDFTG